MTTRHNQGPSDTRDIALKNACRKLVNTYETQAEAGAVIGISQKRISEKINKDTDEWFWLDQIAALEDGIAGPPPVAAALAQRQGYVLVKLPEVAASGTDLLLHYAVLGGAVGQIGAEIGSAMADGCLDGRERRRIDTLLHDLIEKAVAMRAVNAEIGSDRD